jgi:tetrahydromethanopterin S-methyltransferase subunit B
MALTLTDVNTGNPITIEKTDVVSFYDIDELFRRVNMIDGTIHDVSESFATLVSDIGSGGGGGGGTIPSNP